MLPNYAEDDNINSFEQELGQYLSEILSGGEDDGFADLPLISTDEDGD